MEQWRALAVRLFPNYENLYRDSDETIWTVFFDLLREVEKAHRQQNNNQLSRIYGFGEWCFDQRSVNPELWRAAVPAFYEHLVDEEITFREIARWLKPEIFQELLPVFKYRLVDLPQKHAMPRPGTFSELIDMYDKSNGTRFGSQRS